MKRAFTLIELLVSITIVAVISGGALIYLNNFISRQKLEESKSEVISNLRLAQSYAKTRQVPLASVERDLEFVQLQMIESFLVAGANGIGSTYFQVKINDDKLIKLVPNTLYFWGGNGFLSHDNMGTMYGIGETATIFVQSNNNLIGYDQITVNALGQIILEAYNDGMANIFIPTPTLVITPTLAVTPTSIRPTPTTAPTCLLGGSSCSVHGQCCSYYCNSGVCLAPTPTLQPCKVGGSFCSVHGDCCSYYCTSGLCKN